jgi:hypothetical protein
VIIGGGFTRVQNAARSCLARINADGTLHAWNPGASATVSTLALAGTDVIVGGSFTTLGGAARRFIGAVPLASDVATSWNPSTVGGTGVRALAISGTDVIVGGIFDGGPGDTSPTANLPMNRVYRVTTTAP